MLGSYEVDRDIGIGVGKIDRALRNHGATPVAWKFYRRQDIMGVFPVILNDDPALRSALMLPPVFNKYKK